MPSEYMTLYRQLVPVAVSSPAWANSPLHPAYSKTASPFRRKYSDLRRMSLRPRSRTELNNWRRLGADPGTVSNPFGWRRLTTVVEHSGHTG
jgi:hypothetical protein